MKTYNTWKEWNTDYIKLLQKRNAAERVINNAWRTADPAKENARGQRALARALAAIAEHDTYYVASSYSLNICNLKELQATIAQR